MKMLALLCRFVDWDLSRKPVTTAGNLTILLGILPWFLLLTIRDAAKQHVSTPLLVTTISLDVIWFAFVATRAWRLFRVSAERSDRLYDRSGKYALPPEYAETESATSARRKPKSGR